MSFFFETGSEYRKELYVHVEKYNKKERTVLIDFVDSNEFAVFSFFTGLEYNWELRPTMVEIRNYNQKRLKEGSSYEIRKETIINLIHDIEIIEDSLLIGFRINLKDEAPILFARTKSFTKFEKSVRNIDQSERDSLDGASGKFAIFNKVVIRNIGQGNWNEIWCGENVEIVFDIGTIYTTSRQSLLAQISNRDYIYQNSKPILILSHWDVDHYHFLLALQDDTIKSFVNFIYRGVIPNLTARKAIGRFNLLNRTALIPLSAVSPYPLRTSKRLDCQVISANRDLLLFNAYHNNSRNKSGIGLALRCKNTSVIFSGDFDYEQVSSDILPTLNYPCNHYLIVPHHGGKAGRYRYNFSVSNKLAEAIISVGNNPYRPPHPHQINIDNLRISGFKVIRTDRKIGDYEIQL